MIEASHFPADGPLWVSGRAHGGEGCLSRRAATYTHGEGLRPLLDDEAFDDMREDLRLDDGLRRLVLAVLRRTARHGGRLALVP